MLAKVQPFPATPPVPQSIDLIYNAAAVSPTSQFTFDTDTGAPYLFLTEETTTIQVTLQNAEFTANPITWALAPSNWIISDQTAQTLTLMVSAPLHYFCPWVFRFNVNAGGLNGILSPSFFLVLPPDSESATSVTLDYALEDGSFSLDSAIELASEMIMINTITPFEVTISLASVTGVGFDTDSPVLWAGTTPSWITFGTVTSSEVTFTIAATPGQAASFQFALAVVSGVNTVTILSPDPILINATIGDG
jgi:hypothetical protein